MSGTSGQPAAAAPLRAVIFDWAGTLLDFASRAPVQTFVQVFADEGVPVTVAEARAPMGMAKRDHLRAMAQSPGVAARWRARHGGDCTEADLDRMYAAFLPRQRRAVAEHAGLVPGAAEVVRDLRAAGLRLGSTTGYNRELADQCVAAAAEQGLVVDCVVSADDVPAGRPAPWMIFEAMRRLDVYPPAAVVVVDDTAAGLAAARHAGCWAVGVTLTGNEVGVSLAELEAMAPEAVQRLHAQAARRLLDAGAHHAATGVAELPGVLGRIAASRGGAAGVAVD